jgi:pimeloyl-ACP methyl ester carboxylesterase
MLNASRGATRIAAALAGAASTDLRPALAGLPMPVGVVSGERDRIIRPAGIATATALRPGAPVARVAGTGHIPMMERPAAFAQALADVLAASSPSRNTVPGVRS